MFNKIKLCKTIKEIWEKPTVNCEGTCQIKENKLFIAVQKIKNFKMKPGEILDQLDAQFIDVINELASLGKEYIQREIALKVLRVLPQEWDMKRIAMKESKDLSKISTIELFSNLKAFEF